MVSVSFPSRRFFLQSFCMRPTTKLQSDLPGVSGCCSTSLNCGFSQKVAERKKCQRSGCFSLRIFFVTIIWHPWLLSSVFMDNLQNRVTTWPIRVDGENFHPKLPWISYHDGEFPKLQDHCLARFSFNRSRWFTFLPNPHSLAHCFP